MVYIEAIRLSTGGHGSQHITDVRWRNPSTQKADQSTRATMVEWIQNQSGDARVRDSEGHEAQVGVVQMSPPYLRTYADGDWNDNLLALPRF